MNYGYIAHIIVVIAFVLPLSVNEQQNYIYCKDFFITTDQKKIEELTETREVGKYKVTIKYKSFDKSNRKLKFYKNENVIMKIDNQKYYGTDGTIPFREIYSISLFDLEREYSFPVTQYNLLFEPHLGNEFYSDAFSVKEHSSYIEINLSGGDAAGSYEVTWLVFKKSKVIKRQISDILVLNGIQKPKITISKLRSVYRK